MSKESPVSAGNDAYADLDRQVYNCLYLWKSEAGEFQVLVRRTQLKLLMEYIDKILHILPKFKNLS